MNEKQSLDYINKPWTKLGKQPIKYRTLRRIKKYLRDNELTRLYDIARAGFVSQHFARIDNLEYIQNRLFAMAKGLESEDKFKAAQVYVWLTAVQPYLSQYYEASKLIMRKVAEENSKNTNASQASIKSESDYIPVPRS
jgi:hypothetical protein